MLSLLQSTAHLRCLLARSPSPAVAAILPFLETAAQQSWVVAPLSGREYHAQRAERVIRIREPVPLPAEHSILPPFSRRTGLLAIKAGMTQEWDVWGVRVPLTVLWVDDLQVVQVKTEEHEGYNAVQLGCGAKRPKQLKPSQRGHYEKAGVPLKRFLCEFRVSPDCMLPVGIRLHAAHFVAGQYVDVSGTTIGKGFQGVMKKWGFAGGNASHGASLSHRSAGATGACQDPGRVFKGKKMAGRMGGERRTVQGCLVYKVDAVRNLIYVRGQVPGGRGGLVEIKDSVKKVYEDQPPRPSPTFLAELPLEPQLAPSRADDPFDYKES